MEKVWRKILRGVDLIICLVNSRLKKKNESEIIPKFTQLESDLTADSVTFLVLIMSEYLDGPVKSIVKYVTLIVEIYSLHLIVEIH